MVALACSMTCLRGATCLLNCARASPVSPDLALFDHSSNFVPLAELAVQTLVWACDTSSLVAAWSMNALFEPIVAPGWTASTIAAIASTPVMMPRTVSVRRLSFTNDDGEAPLRGFEP
ncbi:Uncharacterised protein [Mycobacteroides abscessus subsp. abscessus]|nr:Uncharacterised protein [Mycobacteroides abscessus subsp. abscessus]